MKLENLKPDYPTLKNIRPEFVLQNLDRKVSAVVEDNPDKENIEPIILSIIIYYLLKPVFYMPVGPKVYCLVPGKPQPKGDYFLIDNPDRAHLIQRVEIHEDSIIVKDSITIEGAKRILEAEFKRTKEPVIADLKRKAE